MSLFYHRRSRFLNLFLKSKSDWAESAWRRFRKKLFHLDLVDLDRLIALHDQTNIGNGLPRVDFSIVVEIRDLDRLIIHSLDIAVPMVADLDRFRKLDCEFPGRDGVRRGVVKGSLELDNGFIFFSPRIARLKR